MAVAVVFVGPSLLAPDRPEIRTVEYRPPAVRGSLIAAADAGIRLIGLVDGELYQRRSVSPAEVRATAARGVTLFGAASLGALRACECPEAMTGIGRVFEAFRDGRLEGDDEVTGTYEPIGERTIAFPLVILREAVSLLVADSFISKHQGEDIITQVRELPFQHRDESAIQRIVESAYGHSIAERVLLTLRSDRAQIKSQDALALIARISDEATLR